MFALLLIFLVVLFGFGFLNPLWWVVAVLAYGVTRHRPDRGGGRIRGGGSDPGDYRAYQERRNRQERWDRRYSRQNRARWRNEDRRDDRRYRARRRDEDRRDHDHYRRPL